MHVHMREPGATYKENYSSGTSAALAGGVTMVLCMPNTAPAIIDQESLRLVHQLAKKGARCDYGIYLGASVDNFSSLAHISQDAIALKMYLNETYTTLRLDDVSVWMKVSGNEKQIVEINDLAAVLPQLLWIYYVAL